MTFNSSLDIVNRGLQHLGAIRIPSLTYNSKTASEANFVYDKCRRSELRANLWNFSARRVILRPYTPGSSQVWFSPVWQPNLTYQTGSVVSTNNIDWVNVIQPTTGQAPGTGAPFYQWNEFPAPAMFNLFSTGTTYYPGEMTAVTLGGLVYVTTAITTVSPPAPPWVLVSPAVVSNYNAVSFTAYPPNVFQLGGVTTGTIAVPKTAYPLPKTYIRVMPQDAKTAAAPTQSSTAGMQFTDYEFEGQLLFTKQTGPIVFRFAADLSIVFWFDDLFCEALACRIALELGETITQSAPKLEGIHSLYQEYIDKAVRVNAIEAGSTEPDTSKVDSQRGPTREKMPPPRQQQ